MKTLRIATIIALFLAIFVVMLGAFTRLTDAGLGCPDWPGCYGKLVLPSSTHELDSAQKTYPEIPIETTKAWTEMIHRYAAGSLLLLIVFIIFRATKKLKKETNLPVQLPVILLFLLAFQAMLGMWTVTMKLLPIVVMGHLLGGFLIFSCLCYLYLHITKPRLNLPKFKIWLNIALIIVFIQIALGGLVSANYAGIACIGFPKCNGLWLPNLDFTHAFNLFTNIGVNHQGGILDNISRATLQFTHRIGAAITLLYLLALSGYMLFTLRNKMIKRFAITTIILVSLQFTLGVCNVLFLLPLWVAVLHNGCAALLLASVLSLRFLVSSGDNNAR